MKTILINLILTVCVFAQFASPAHLTMTESPIDSMFLSWKSVNSEISTVEWGFTDSYGNTLIESVADTFHHFTLTGLQANDTIYYRITSATIDHSTRFYTPAPVGDCSEFKVLIVGDVQWTVTNPPDSSSVVFDSIRTYIANNPVDMAIALGDCSTNLFNTSTLDTFFTRFDFCDSIPLIAVPGNTDNGAAFWKNYIQMHDADTESNQGFMQSVNVQNVDFLVLPAWVSFGIFTDNKDSVLTWFEREVENSSADIMITLVHYWGEWLTDGHPEAWWYTDPDTGYYLREFLPKYVYNNMLCFSAHLHKETQFHSIDRNHQIAFPVPSFTPDANAPKGFAVMKVNANNVCGDIEIYINEMFATPPKVETDYNLNYRKHYSKPNKIINPFRYK